MDNSGTITRFGAFGEWFKALERLYPTNAEKDRVLTVRAKGNCSASASSTGRPLIASSRARDYVLGWVSDALRGAALSDAPPLALSRPPLLR